MNGYKLGTKTVTKTATAATFRSGARTGYLAALLAMLMASPCVFAEDPAGMAGDTAIDHAQPSVSAPGNDAAAAVSRPAGKPSRALTRASRELSEGMAAFQDLLVRDPVMHDGELVVAVQWRK